MPVHVIHSTPQCEDAFTAVIKSPHTTWATCRDTIIPLKKKMWSKAARVMCCTQLQPAWPVYDIHSKGQCNMRGLQQRHVSMHSHTKSRRLRQINHNANTMVLQRPAANVRFPLTIISTLCALGPVLWWLLRTRESRLRPIHNIMYLTRWSRRWLGPYPLPFWLPNPLPLRTLINETHFARVRRNFELLWRMRTKWSHFGSNWINIDMN